MKEARDDVRFCSHSGLKLGTALSSFFDYQIAGNP
jgi:hypothetical protein